jgi:hypothetical protein
MKLIGFQTNSVNGQFLFNNLIPGKYFVKAIVKDTLTYQNLMTTWYENVGYWSNATSIDLECDSTFAFDLIMKAKPLVTPGNINILGRISYVSNNKSTMGEPIPGVQITLEQEPEDQPIANSQPDSISGDYGFYDLPIHNYSLAVDIPGLPQLDTIYVDASIDDSTYSNLNYFVDTTSVEPGVYSSLGSGINYTFSSGKEKVSIYPMPFNEILFVDIELSEAGKIDLVIYDNYGKTISAFLDKQYLACGKHHFELNIPGIEKMMYLKMKNYSSKSVYVKKIVRN